MSFRPVTRWLCDCGELFESEADAVQHDAQVTRSISHRVEQFPARSANLGKALPLYWPERYPSAPGGMVLNGEVLVKLLALRVNADHDPVYDVDVEVPQIEFDECHRASIVLRKEIPVEWVSLDGEPDRILAFGASKDSYWHIEPAVRGWLAKVLATRSAP